MKAFLSMLFFANGTAFISDFDPTFSTRIQEKYRHARLHHRHYSSDILEDDKNFNSPASKTTCSHCGKVFYTRNSLFKHLRTDPICSVKASAGRLELVKESVALQFGYTDFIDRKNYRTVPKSEQVGKIVQSTLITSLKIVAEFHFRESKKQKNSDTDLVEFLGSTQASRAKHRQRALSQEAGCTAGGDVMIINVMVPKRMNRELWSLVGETMQDELADGEKPNIKLFTCQLLGQDSKMHAERSATQYIYHYLLPLSWLPDATLLQDWWDSAEIISSVDTHVGKKLSSKPPDPIRQLKEALRKAECKKLSANDIQSDVYKELRTAAGRFGSLGAREKRAWHSFAAPSLKGDASPNNEAVWRVVDRARIVDFVDDENGQLHAVIEIKGDSFIQEQVRRIVGSAIGISNEWLPTDFFELSTQADLLVETPIAPPNRLYLKSVRYHFDEMQSKGLPFFEPHESRAIVSMCPNEQKERYAQRAILRQLYANDEKKWLERLKNQVCPRIVSHLEQQTGDPVFVTEDDSESESPEAYNKVLIELRRILGNGLWPETSMARSNVIRQHFNNAEPARKDGSFTIVNPNIQTNHSLPLGNSRFPDLVEAVFELENILSKQERARCITVNDSKSDVSIADRQASSHCAVNCNAQFTPHVDSGRGSGQKLSMIVGMGNYAGGELLVEGEPFNIQYQLLVFDGWRLRHWTNRFAGERFSLGTYHYE
jgi:tRNA U38,U39,U40 pseudouridine synthase TruA